MFHFDPSPVLKRRDDVEQNANQRTKWKCAPVVAAVSAFPENGTVWKCFPNIVTEATMATLAKIGEKNKNGQSLSLSQRRRRVKI